MKGFQPFAETAVSTVTLDKPATCAKMTQVQIQQRAKSSLYLPTSND